MDFDGRLLAAAGGFGRRGRRLAAASGLPAVPLALGVAAGLLLSATPPHRCRPDPALLPAALRNASAARLLDAAVPRGPDGAWSPCLLFRPPPPPNATGPCTRGWDYALPAAAGLRATAATQWDLVCAKQWQVPLEQTTYLLGWILGYLAFGAAGDRFGRRAAFLLPLGLAFPLGIAVALAVNFVMLAVLRLLFGAMLAGAFLSLYVARLELCDPPHRLIVTMGAGFCWVFGELLLPGLAVACKEWRLLQGAATLGLVLPLLCWWSPSLFPESARWLLATRQLEKAQRALRSLAEGNGVCLEEEFYSAEHLLAGGDGAAPRGAEPVSGAAPAPVPWPGGDLWHSHHREELPHPGLHGLHRERDPALFHPQPDSLPAALLPALLPGGRRGGGGSPLPLPDCGPFRAPASPPAGHHPAGPGRAAPAGPDAAPEGLARPDPLRPRHPRLARRHGPQRLLCLRSPAHCGQGCWAGPHPGCQHGGPGRHPPHGHPPQPGLLPAPRGLCLLRHPVGAEHHAAPGDQWQAPAGLHARRGEPAEATPLPLQPTAQGSPAAALALAGGRRAL